LEREREREQGSEGRMEPMEGVVREGFEGLGVKVGGTWEAKP